MTGLLGHLAGWPLALSGLHAPTFWLPKQASTEAPMADSAFYFVFWVSTFFTVLIFVWLIAFLWRYRERPGHVERDTPHHNLPLEVTWSVIPLAITIYMFWIGFRGFMDQYNPPGDGLPIAVQAQQWSWTFTYPNGATTGEMHVPVGENVILTMTSSDVIHSLFVPDFRIKRDVVPGRYHKLWFNAPVPGEHHLFCTEYCGTNHSSMITKVVVEDRAKYEAWLKETSNFDTTIPPREAGERWYNIMGCKQCHSIDGKASTGPTWKNLWGEHVQTSAGQVTVDENYVSESVNNPSAKIVNGFANVMPSFQGRLEQKSITNIIAFMKSLSDKTSPEELKLINTKPEKKQAGGAAAPEGAATGAPAAGTADAAAPPAAADNGQAASGGK